MTGHSRFPTCLRSAVLAGALALAAPSGAFEPLSGLAETDRLVFALGVSQWDDVWKPAPDPDVARDGLGPYFNAASCEACHPGGGAGPGPRHAPDAEALARRLAVFLTPADPEFGEQLQAFTTIGTAEPRPAVSWQTIEPATDDDAPLVRPRYGPVPGLAASRALSGRTAPQVFGLGLLAAVPEAAILALADPDDADGDGVSGRPARVETPGGVRLGRFGWRAERASLGEQVSHALSREMGLSTPLFPNAAGDCTGAQAACREAPSGAGDASGPTEVPGSVVEQLTAAIALSAPPPSGRVGDGEGRRIFAEIGCARCHRPWLPAGDRRVAAYTDLLLHDMGEGLADRDASGRIVAAEWRTAPLWGLGARASAAEPGLLHDGRALSVTEAILWHGGEAAAARHAFGALEPDRRDAVLSFLESL